MSVLNTKVRDSHPAPAPMVSTFVHMGYQNTNTVITGLEQPSGQGDPARLKGDIFPLPSCAPDLSQRPHYPGHQQKYRQRKAQHVDTRARIPR